MVLTCERNSDNTYDIVTRTHGSLKETIPRTSSTRMITVVDSSRPNPIVAIKCYDGLLKTIPISSEHKQLNVSTLR